MNGNLFGNREKEKQIEKSSMPHMSLHSEVLGHGDGRHGSSSSRKEPKTPKARKNAAKLNKSNLKLKCGACGGLGHMKTNKACPKFVGDPNMDGSGPINVAMTENDEEEMEKNLLEVINVLIASTNILCYSAA
jgi:hypothetical protein